MQQSNTSQLQALCDMANAHPSSNMVYAVSDWGIGWGMHKDGTPLSSCINKDQKQGWLEANGGGDAQFVQEADAETALYLQ